MYICRLTLSPLVESSPPQFFFSLSCRRLVGMADHGACVLDAGRDPFGRRPSALRVDPRRFRLVQDGQRIPDGMRLDDDPFEGR